MSVSVELSPFVQASTPADALRSQKLSNGNPIPIYFGLYNIFVC